MCIPPIIYSHVSYSIVLNYRDANDLFPVTMHVHYALDNNQIALVPDDKNDMDDLTDNFLEVAEGVRWKNNVHQVLNSQRIWIIVI